MVAYLLLAMTAILPTYEEALAKATKQNLPLVVIVGAKWCDPCQTLKAELPKFGIRDCVITYVDIDDDPALAKQLMVEGEKIPQIVVFGRANERGPWKRVRAIGRQTKDRVLEMIQRAIR